MDIYTTGRARFQNPDSLLNWLRGLTYADATDFRDGVRCAYRDSQRALGNENVKNDTLFDYEYDKTPISAIMQYDFECRRSWCGENDREEAWKESREKTIAKYRTFICLADDFRQDINVCYWVKGAFAFLFLGNKEKGIVVPSPEKNLEYIPPLDRDHADMTAAQVRESFLMGGGGNGIDVISSTEQSSLTKSGVDAKIVEAQSSLEKIKAQMREVEQAANGEFAALRQEIERKTAELEARKAALLADLSEKKASMEIQIEQFGVQVYMLEAQIYAIECYVGETIKFAKLREGKNAPDDTPVVVHQKFRYLDEELGKLASLYEIQWNEIDMFEQFLRHHPIALETFAPDERCVVVVRLSKTGTTLGRDSRFPYENVMKT